MAQNINWYPGHMKKTRELIQNNLKMVDAVIEVIDARIPVSSRNPIIDELVSAKPRIIALNKSDLADAKANSLWKSIFRKPGFGGDYERHDRRRNEADFRLARKSSGGADRTKRAEAVPPDDRRRAQLRQVLPDQPPDRTQKHQDRRQARESRRASSG